ncbi:MAG: hypothetical protein ACI8RD_000314 [Bacillariaceae sp.]|jgi:hypothetical protein
MGIKCVIHLDPTFPPKTTTNNNSTDTSNYTVGGMDTKRAVLEYLQKHCSIDFLREQKINSKHSEVVLRKTNRKALLKIWGNWNKQQHQQHQIHSSEASSNTTTNNQRLKEIYKELLQFNNHERSPTTSKKDKQTKIVAGTLHESCEEFPCFSLNREEHGHGNELEWSSSSSRQIMSYHICLLLGAVRDMTSKYYYYQ